MRSRLIFTSRSRADDDIHIHKQHFFHVIRPNTAIMAAIGSLVFCTDCGNLLETNTSRKTYLNCEVCGAQNKGEDMISADPRDLNTNNPQTPPARPSPQPPSPQPSPPVFAHACVLTCRNSTKATSKPTPSSTTLAKSAATLRHDTTPSNYDPPTKVARSSTLARSARTSGTRTTDRALLYCLENF